MGRTPSPTSPHGGPTLPQGLGAAPVALLTLSLDCRGLEVVKSSQNLSLQLFQVCFPFCIHITTPFP